MSRMDVIGVVYGAVCQLLCEVRGEAAQGDCGSEAGEVEQCRWDVSGYIV